MMRTKSKIRLICQALASLMMASALHSIPGMAAESSAPDPMDVAAALIRDASYERAKEVLNEVDSEIRPFDFVRYYTLTGIMQHHRGYPEVSNIYLQKAIEMGQSNQGIGLYIAKNHFQLHEYQSVIDVLNRTGDAALLEPQMYVMKAEAYKGLGDFHSAWDTLDKGIRQFPEYSRYYLQKFYYLVELGYYQSALDYADQYLQKKDYSDKEFLAVAYALREHGELDKAAQLLEEGVLRHPQNERLIELLGQVYIDKGSYLAAATVFDQASIEYPQFAHKAAVLFLKANQPARSLQLNRRITEQKAKFLQRVSIDIYLEDYEALAAKTDALKRYGLLQQDDIRYAVGYAYYRNQDYDSATRYLKQINDSELFARASSIFRIIERCQREPVQCI